VQFLREDISVSARGMIHKSRTSRSTEKVHAHQSGRNRLMPDPNSETREIVTRDICKEDLKFGDLIGKGASGLVYRGIYLPENVEVGIKSINIFDPDKRHQLVNDLKSFTVHKQNFHYNKNQTSSVQPKQARAQYSCPF
jgi:hypothetical protein